MEKKERFWQALLKTYSELFSPFHLQKQNRLNSGWQKWAMSLLDKVNFVGYFLIVFKVSFISFIVSVSVLLLYPKKLVGLSFIIEGKE